MYIHNDKKSRTTDNLRSKQSTESRGSAFQLVDNRAEAVAQRELQSSMSNAPQTMQLKSWQDLANNSSGSGSSHIAADTSTGSVSGSFMQNGIFQLQAKPVVTGVSKDSVKLSNLVNSLFKAAPAGGAVIGDGSALAACSHEHNGGEKVGGADHQVKCQQVLNGINNLITRAGNQTVIDAGNQLSDDDYNIAVALKTDLEAALAGTYEQDEEDDNEE